MQSEILRQLYESAEVKRRVAQVLLDAIEMAAKALVVCYQNGGKVLLCGNGGSAADAQHLAGELVGRFQRERRAVPAIALSTDTSILTALGNDYGYDYTFARQVEAWAQPGDVLVAISTSGNSSNVLAAVEAARQRGAVTIGLTGKDGGQLAGACDIPITVPSDDTPRIQEAHITIGHILCGLLEATL
jgi:D-sedoheptulose 7-phosphate isomerase